MEKKLSSYQTIKLKGFTFIEVVIVVALVVIISATALISLSGYRTSQNLKLAANEIFSVIKDVQNRSITQQDGKQWGLRFTNATSGTQSYETFSGASYATSAVDRLYSLARNVKFGEPGPSSTVDVVFSAISGKLSANKIISLISGRQDGLVSDVILRKDGPITIRHDNGLVGYWHLDENIASTTYDASGFGNTGTLTNGPMWQSASNCKAGTCLSFDGVNDYVNVANNSVLQVSNFTIAAWVKRDVLDNSFREIVRKGVDYFLLINNENELALGIENADFANGYALSGTGNWEHVAATFDNSTRAIKIYLNGNLVHSLTAQLTLSVGTDPLRIGATEVDTQFFDGQIDEVRIYNRVLSAAEVQNLYNDLR